MARKERAELLREIDAAANELAEPDEPEAVEEIRAALRGLVEDEPSARAEAYGDLAARFMDACFAPLVLVPLLVDLAESLDDPARCAALGVLVGVGAARFEEAPWLRDIDRAFASMATRLDALAGFFGTSARLARRAARRARGKRYSPKDILRDLERVEEALARPVREQARRMQAAELQPEALAAAARACEVVDEKSASHAITLAHRCANVGRPEDALLVYDKLGEFRMRAEPARVRALVRLGRVQEARDAAVSLATAWLTPATSHRSANQVLCKDHVQEMLRDVQTSIGGKELDALARAVDIAQIEVFVEMGTDSF